MSNRKFSTGARVSYFQPDRWTQWTSCINRSPGRATGFAWGKTIHWNNPTSRCNVWSLECANLQGFDSTSATDPDPDGLASQLDPLNCRVMPRPVVWATLPPGGRHYQWKSSKQVFNATLWIGRECSMNQHNLLRILSYLSKAWQNGTLATLKTRQYYCNLWNKLGGGAFLCRFRAEGIGPVGSLYELWVVRKRNQCGDQWP
jgi:hypothetical protein